MAESTSTRTQSYRQVAIATGAGEDVLLFRKATIVDQLSRLFQIEVDLLSENGDVPFDEVVGKPASIRLHQTQDSEIRYFNGIVSRFVHTGGTGRSAHYRMTIVPWLWLATRMSDCRIFQGMKVPDIIKKVFDDRGFADYDINVGSGYETREYVVQYRETDFNFVSRLMEEEGIYYYWKHEDGKHTMMIVDNLASHVDYPGYETVNYYPYTEVSREQEYVWEWVVEQEVQSGMYDQRDYNFENPGQPMDAAKTLPSTHEQGDMDQFEYPGNYMVQAEGERRSQVRLEELHGQHDVIRGRGDVRGFQAGYTFTLAEHPRETQNKKYLITSVTSVIESDEYNSTMDGSDATHVFRCVFTAMDAGKQFRARRVTPKPLVHGCQTATVSGPDNEEIHVDKYGRVRVIFHWDRDPGKSAIDDTVKKDETSCWVRVAQIWAGRKWGAIFLPRIGQEVVVDFENGDPDRPIITGSVYNGTQKVPYDLPGNKTVSCIKSYSSKGGDGFNEIRFEDKKGSEQVMIHSQRRMDVRVRSSLYETAGGNREERVGYEDKGDHNIFVCADTNHQVNGGYFLKIGKVLNETVVGDVVEDYQAKQTTMAAARRSLNAPEMVYETSGTLSLKADKLIGQGASLVSLKSGSVHIEATQDLCLKVGGNFITIDCGGVYINGTMVSINSGGAAQPADAPLAFEAPEIEEPLEAYGATTALPGEMSRGSGGGRTRNRRTIPVLRAPEPPLPPPPGTCGPSTPVTPTEPTDTIELIEVKELRNGNYEAVETRKQFVNLDPSTTHSEQGRTINLRAKIKWRSGSTNSLAGQTVYWYFTPDGGNRASLTPASCRAGFLTEGGAARHTSTTDADGYAYADFVVSQYGGDKFQPFATLDAGYAGGIQGGNYTVWRKMNYELDCMARPGGGSFSDRADTAGMTGKFNALFVELTQTGTDATPAHQRVLTSAESQAWIAAVRDGSGAPRYFHLVLCDAICVRPTDTTINVTLRKGTQRTVQFGNNTLDPRDWFISCAWDDGAGGHAGTLDAAKFSALRDLNPYPSGTQATDVDLSSIPLPDGTDVNLTMHVTTWTELSGLQQPNGPVTIIGMRWRERVHAGNAGNITASTLNTMVHEPGHAMGLAATTKPDGGANATTVFNNGHHCRNISNRCVMFDSNSTNTDLCPICSDALRGRKLTALPISGGAAYA